jgi:DNA invertase Pin-like site-specific DNA recombinase
LQQALSVVEKHEAGVLVVTKLDRLSRSVRDILELVEGRFASNGGNLVSIADNLDATNAMGKFVLTILAGLAQMERELVSERTRSALAHVKSTGRHLGAVPYGKKLDEDGRLVSDREAQLALRRARRMRKRGASWREIAEKMDWTVSQARTRLDPSYRAKTRAGWEHRRNKRR